MNLSFFSDQIELVSGGSHISEIFREIFPLDQIKWRANSKAKTIKSQTRHQVK